MKLVPANCEYQEDCPDRKRLECPRLQEQCGLRFMISLDRCIELTIDDLELSQEDIDAISERLHNNPKYKLTAENRGFGRYEPRIFRKEAYFYVAEKSHQEAQNYPKDINSNTP